MKISSLTLRTIAAILFVAANAINAANAQLPTASPHESIPLLAAGWVKAGTKIFVVTVGQPDVPHTCRVVGVETNRILCSHRLHSQPTVYYGEDIEALITPGKHAPVWLYFSGFLAAGAGVIIGACFLASLTIVGAIPVAIVGGLLLWGAPLSGMIADDDDADELVYQRPGTTLAIELR